MNRYRVAPGASIDLEQIDPRDKSAFPIDKDAGIEKLKALNEEMEMLQERLYAEGI